MNVVEIGMNTQKRIFLCFLITAILTQGCDKTDGLPGIPSGGNNNTNTQWLIPAAKVVDGGPGKDGIPSINSPKFESAATTNTLQPNNLVVGVIGNDGPKAYSHRMLDWHEIANDVLDQEPVSIIYCPLTGTATGWSRKLDGVETTFGVSGLLYQNNIIPYDRKTDSRWSQMQNVCVNGTLAGKRPTFFQVVETTWDIWKTMYPDTKVMSETSTTGRNYNLYPYGDYRTNNDRYVFPVLRNDPRLGSKDRVLGVIIDSTNIKNGVLAYPISRFADSTHVLNETVLGDEIVVVGDARRNFAVCYKRKLNGTTLTFTAIQDGNQLLMQDQEGNQWDIFGVAQNGPRKGQKLDHVLSYIGYWFAWAEFYPGLVLKN